MKTNINHFKRNLILSFLLVAVNMLSMAQNINVSGKVIDNEGLPVFGATIQESLTGGGTITDIDGKFEMTVTSEDVELKFSFVGMKSTSLKVGAQREFNITLESNNVGLDELVVVGYTTQSKKDITGAVSVVNADDLENSIYANAMQSLQGKVGGLTITQDGQPGSGNTQVRVRGITTVNNNNPLYVIDGVPVETSIDNINPNDIESMQVLKDAAAASIYGSRSAGGVIIITTKKGKEGKVSINASAQLGVQTIANKINLLNGTEWGSVYYQASQYDFPNIEPSHPLYINTGNGFAVNTVPQLLPNGQVYQFTNEGTDWYDEVYQKASTKQYNVSVSNGSKKGNFYLGASYFDQNGLIKQTFYDRFTTRANSLYKLTDWFEVGQNLSVSYSNQVQIGSQKGQDGIPLDVIRQHPLHPVYDLQNNYGGRIAGLPDVRNMVSVLDKNQDNNQRSLRLLGNMYASVNLFDAFHFIPQSHDLIVKTNFGVDYNDYYKRQFNASYSEGDYDIQDNSLTNDYGRNATVTWTNTLEYSFNKNKH
ncbi:MAG: SusC/RagA family TonB-linked outer membrane protein [Bacteroidales bacterium]|jgi:TonB-linked SusC/RagA family outer membrane protein|nr:SusC/RagA family TonB-linked outer membrane protein [Bacteroidales bacterium]